MSRFLFPYGSDDESDGDYEANKDVEGYEDVDVNEDAEREAYEILEEESFHSSSISNVKEGLFISTTAKNYDCHLRKFAGFMNIPFVKGNCLPKSIFTDLNLSKYFRGLRETRTTVRDLEHICLFEIMIVVLGQHI